MCTIFTWHTRHIQSGEIGFSEVLSEVAVTDGVMEKVLDAEHLNLSFKNSHSYTVFPLVYTLLKGVLSKN